MARKPQSNASTSDNRDEADAIAVLTSDHNAVKDLFTQYSRLSASPGVDDEEKETLATRICLELTVHTQIEEEILYPALRAAFDDDALLDEAEVEHSSIKDLIRELQSMNASEELYDANVTVLGEYVDHHVKEEEEEMFRDARKAGIDLTTLGAELRNRQSELRSELGIDDDEAVPAHSSRQAPAPRDRGRSREQAATK